MSAIGVIFLAASLHGYLLRPLPYWQRGVALVTALLLVKPGLYSDIAGAVLAGSLLVIQNFGQRQSALAAAKAARSPGERRP
jgi:TRAP-type uncharacterized transport system fused permease subunit